MSTALSKIKSAAAELKAGMETSQCQEFSGLNHWNVVGLLTLAIEELAASPGAPVPAPGAEPAETPPASADDQNAP